MILLIRCTNMFGLNNINIIFIQEVFFLAARNPLPGVCLVKKVRRWKYKLLIAIYHLDSSQTNFFFIPILITHCISKHHCKGLNIYNNYMIVYLWISFYIDKYSITGFLFLFICKISYQNIHKFYLVKTCLKTSSRQI